MQPIRPLLLTAGFVILLCTWAAGQTYRAQLLDKSDGQPVAYANIGVLGSDIGTNSDSAGWVTVHIPDSLKDKYILVSMIGYESYKTTVDLFVKELPAHGGRIYLNKKTNELKEVVIKPGKLKTARLGNDIYCSADVKGGQLPFPFPFDEKRKGKVVKVDTLTEIGTLMKVRHKKTFLDSVQIHVGSCTYEHILYRLNVYEKINGDFKNILDEPVYIRRTKDKVGRSISIDLSGKQLVVHDDFIVSIEKVKELGAGTFTICGKLFGAPMYMRMASQQEAFWKVPVIGMGMVAFVTFSEQE